MLQDLIGAASAGGYGSFGVIGKISGAKACKKRKEDGSCDYWVVVEVGGRDRRIYVDSSKINEFDKYKPGDSVELIVDVGSDAFISYVKAGDADV